MAEIKCPNCGEIIKLDKSSYDSLLNEIEKEEIEKRVKSQSKAIEDKLKAQYELESTKAKVSQDNEIASLRGTIKVLEEKLNNNDNIVKVEVTKAIEKAKDEIAKKEQTISNLNLTLETVRRDATINEQKLKEQYEAVIAQEKSETEKWKSFRYGDSTKDLGESLEKYCHDSFDEIRADAYPNAYFEKDNEVVEGSKGDFVFRDFSPDGIELVSIMFEMKTEKDNTESKKTNESHLKKLDSDRTKKGCEYAVLVSTLESDSKLYNRGIVDVSHRYPKMFVVRPQHFLTIIGLIRNMALKSYEYKKQMVTYQNEHLDITTFEDDVRAIGEKISSDYQKASEIYSGVDEMCDKMIKKIEEFRGKFKTAAGYIGKAEKQIENLSIRKLTRHNPTMKAKFAELESEKK